MVKVVDAAVLLDCAECVELHLWIALGRYRYAFAVLEIDDLKCAIAEDNHVAGPETVLDPAAEIQSLLDECQPLCRIDFLNAQVDVLADVLVHLWGIQRIVPYGLDAQRLLLIGNFAEVAPNLCFCQRVGEGSFSRRLSRLVREFALKARRRRAGEPPLACRRAQNCVRHQSALAAIRNASSSSSGRSLSFCTPRSSRSFLSSLVLPLRAIAAASWRTASRSAL